MTRPKPYSVPSGSETPDEPFSGIYWAHDGDEGERVIRGPYRTKWDAEDAITNYVRQQKAAGCGCREGECESKPKGCRMAEEVKPGSGAQ